MDFIDEVIHEKTAKRNLKLVGECQNAKALFISLRDTSPAIREDVVKRVADWIESGGEFDDSYVLGQLEFAKKGVIDIFD